MSITLEERQNSRHDAQALAPTDKEAMTCCSAAVATRRSAGHTSQAKKSKMVSTTSKTLFD